ncbi:MAG: glycoside hydrolase family 2 TIM barrel-domain containing protein [Faecousia sp.]
MKKIHFNDHWSCNGKAVTLPHDAMIHEARTTDAPSGSAQAFFPGGSYVYEKTFEKPDGEHVIFQFEGVYKNAKVFLNGQEAGSCDYGYSPFFVCADEFLRDGENTIRVECENNDQPDSRWYTGSGIYRSVWLWTGCKGGIEPEQVRVHTVSLEPATIHVHTGHNNAKMEILDGETVVAKGCGYDTDIVVPNAKLWSAETPNLYTCRVSVEGDEAVVTFGIRTITWDNKGFYINGKSTLLRGGCVHHDNGILGAATPDEADWRRVRIMKDAGFNAIRSAHNPCSRAMLDACDYYGMYMMDESWDMWFHHKNKFDYAAHWRKNYLSDLASMVSRDYNHPSVVMYSIGNEVSEPAKAEGVEKTKEMVAFLHEADGTRPVTGGFNLMIIANAKKGKGIYNEEGGMNNDADKMQGMNSTMFNMITNMVGSGMNKSANGKAADEATTPCLDALDMAGYNYASGRYPLDGKAHPNRLIFGSETFPYDIAKNWKMVHQYDYLVGDFMWTAWDYLGEAGIGAWAYTKDGTGFNKPYPWLLADTGALDILGTPNAEMFWAQAAWGLLSKPVISVQPVNHPGMNPAKMAWRGTNALASWAWSGCEGNKAIVEVYSDAATIELYLNGKKLGKKKVKDCRAIFKTKYAPGKIEAVAYDAAGREVSRSHLESATGKLRICAAPEVETAAPGEVVYINVALVGENGVVESNADRKLTVTVEGSELLGFGSANPRTEDRFDAGEYTTYYGKALAAARVGENCTVTVTDGRETVKTVIWKRSK